MKTLLNISILLIISNFVLAQNKNIDTLSIKTSIQCDMCEERVGELLVFEKGVKDFDINLESQMVKVTYKTKRTSPDKLRKAIAGVGYDADHVAADPEAYEKLPACCKKPGDPDHSPHHH